MKTKDFYKSKAWQTLRNQVMLRDKSRCKWCGRVVFQAGGPRVDHIETLKNRPDLAMDITNLRLLCAQCDNKRHFEKGQAGLRARGIEIKKVRRAVGPDGFPLDED